MRGKVLSGTRAGLFSVVITVVFALAGVPSPLAAQDLITLRTVVPIDVPVIENHTLRLKVDLVFDHCPEEYWLHYNNDAGRLVIEFFGVHVDAPQVRIRGTTVISDLKIVNNETMFSLNGKGSRISMLIEEGWHYDSRIIGGKVLRIQLWMPLNPSATLEAKKKRPLLPILLLVAVVVGVTTGILLSQVGSR